MTETVATIGAELKAAREAGRIYRWEIAQRLGVSDAKLNRFEAGQPEPESFVERYRQALDDLSRASRETVLQAIGRAH